MIYERQLLVYRALFDLKNVCCFSEKQVCRFPMGSYAKTLFWSDSI
jgi:hypothetical protein